MLLKRLLDLGIVELVARLSVLVGAVHSVELVVADDSLRIVLELFICDVIDVFNELLDIFFLSTSFSIAYDSFDLLKVLGASLTLSFLALTVFKRADLVKCKRMI